MDTFEIMGYKFEIFEQLRGKKADREYAIQITSPHGSEFWLAEPQRRYETLGGCYEAILLYIQEVSKLEGHN